MNIIVTTPKGDQDKEVIKDDLDSWADHFMALDDDGKIGPCHP